MERPSGSLKATLVVLIIAVAGQLGFAPPAAATGVSTIDERCRTLHQAAHYAESLPYCLQAAQTYASGARRRGDYMGYYTLKQAEIEHFLWCDYRHLDRDHDSYLAAVYGRRLVAYLKTYQFNDVDYGEVAHWGGQLDEDAQLESFAQ